RKRSRRGYEDCFGAVYRFYLISKFYTVNLGQKKFTGVLLGGQIGVARMNKLNSRRESYDL
ncbi:MAG: hypothetical protein WCA08_24940, partial [Desulfoferrobacter sp.]